jgi:precorrin-6B methylase 2
MGLALRTWWRAVAGWAFNGKYMAPYVPTNEYIVSEILKLAALTHTDRLFDVGCGDGRTPPPTHRS